MAQPLRTAGKARDLVRGMTAGMTADITVYLRGGTYPQTSTLTFTNADSGQNGHYVKYLAYTGEQPIITGGQPITGWTASSTGNGIYTASGITTPFRQLYVNGVKAIRARTPNLGTNGAFAFNRLTGADNTNENIQVASSEVSSWNNFTKVEMHVMTGWGDSTLRLASSTTTGNTAYLKVQSPESTIVFVRPFPHLGGQFGGFTKHCYYFENALEFLDQPGEWYLDEGKGVLSYKPRSGEDMTKAVVVAPMVETVVSIAGTSTTSQAGYLWFQGITFAHSTYMRPSQSGFLDGQAGQYNITATSDNKQTVGRPAAGVSVMNANHIHFERNIFTQMGGTGLDFISGTNNDMIIGNVVTDIAGNGISIGKFTASDTTEYHVPYNPTDKNEICTSDTIKDNYIHNVTTEFQGGTGIAAGYPKQLDIEHNEIAYTNYTGISVGYGWTSTVNAMSNNYINYNNVHHVTQILADGASLYTLSNQQPASQMEYNYLHDYATEPVGRLRRPGHLPRRADQRLHDRAQRHGQRPDERRPEQHRHEHRHRQPRQQLVVRHLHGRNRGNLCRHQDHDDSGSELLSARAGRGGCRRGRWSAWRSRSARRFCRRPGRAPTTRSCRRTTRPIPRPWSPTGRVYLITTHDENAAGQPCSAVAGYTLCKWFAYSSADMVNWTDHGDGGQLEIVQLGEHGGVGSTGHPPQRQVLPLRPPEQHLRRDGHRGRRFQQPHRPVHGRHRQAARHRRLLRRDRATSIPRSSSTMTGKRISISEEAFPAT